MNRSRKQTQLAAWASVKKRQRSQKLLTQSLLLNTHILQANASLKDLVLVCSSTGRKKEIQNLPLSKTNLLKASSRFGRGRSTGMSRMLFPSLVGSKNSNSCFKLPKKVHRNDTTLSVFNKRKVTLRSRFSGSSSFVLSQTNRILAQKEGQMGSLHHNLNKFLTKSSLQKYFGNSNQKLPSLAPLNTLCLNFQPRGMVPEQYPKMKVFESLKGQNLDLSRQIQTTYSVKKKNKKFSKKNSEKLFRKLFLNPKKNDLIKMKKTASVQKLREIADLLGLKSKDCPSRLEFEKLVRKQPTMRRQRSRGRRQQSLDLNAFSRKRKCFSPAHLKVEEKENNHGKENDRRNRQKVRDLVCEDTSPDTTMCKGKKSNFARNQASNFSHKVLKTDNFKIVDTSEKNKMMRQQIINFEDQLTKIRYFNLRSDDPSDFLFSHRLTLMSILVASVSKPISQKLNMRNLDFHILLKRN